MGEGGRAVTTVLPGIGVSGYDRFVGRWSRLYAPALLAAAKIAAGQRVLDVATGTGEAALAAGSCVGPSGVVLGVDISLAMLDVARAKAAGEPIRVIAMDGQALACWDRAFDAVICQLGLMLFPNVRQGLEELGRVLRPGGRLGVCVWSAPERVPMFGILKEALLRHEPAQRNVLEQPYSLADAHRLAGLLTAAGFRDVCVAREVREIVYASFKEYWDPVEAGAGRSGQIYLGLPEGARSAVREEVRQCLSQFESGGRLEMEAEALIASGTR